MTDSVKVPAYEAVAAVVRRCILAGELRPGQRLPS
ncbi:GntR family transcriptional regulator [Nocardioides sp. zg-DK7169]|nr:GntR family transcriptional regulator [Nocardioides sp. zg-DK7169]NPC97840.1 GntR family transcriptional regulator [Nocardioides sp. zg-DK7169]